MSFLFPAMLAGFAALSIPVVLHLIARQKFPVLDFPTIRLLEGERRTNTLALRLVDVPQLLLRLLVLALLILAMSRLFAPWLSSKPATHNRIIVLDASAAMLQSVDQPGGKGKITVFDLGKQRAAALLNDVSAPSRASVIIAGGDTLIAAPLEPGHDHALTAINNAKAYDACGSGLVSAVSRACDMLRGRREISSEIIVLTNLRKSAFDYRSQLDLQRIAAARTDLGGSLHLLFVDLAPQATENLAITHSAVRGRKVMVGADAHIISTIANTGTKEQTTKVTLAVGERKEPISKSIKIAPGSSATVDLTSRVNRAMRTFARVSIDEDSYPFDDQFDVPLPVVDTRRVLIVNGQSQAGAGDSPTGTMAGSTSPTETKPAASHESEIDGATILRFVLNPGRELGGASSSGIDPTVVTPEAVAAQPLSKYELVVLYDVSSLSDAVMADLATFVSEGKSLLIVCSGKTSARTFNRTLALGSGDRPALAPAELGNEIDSPVPLELSLKDTSHPLLSAFADPRHGDLSVIRSQKIRGLQRLPEGTSVILQTTAQQPLALERAIGRGHVVMLTFGLELDRGNIARTRVFPPLMWRLTDYLTGQLKTLPPDQFVARTPAALDVGETNFALTSDLEIIPANAAATQPAGATPMKLPASAQRTVLVRDLAPGRYLLQKARSPGETAQIVTYARGIAVQTDPRASDMTRVAPAELSRLFGSEPGAIVSEVPSDLTPAGGEFWKIFVVILFFAYAAEAIVGFIATARREKERAPGMGVAP
jgi:hypothetical protein